MEAAVSVAPDHPSLKVKRSGKYNDKVRRTYELVGCGAGHNYRAYNNTINAMERAFKERMLFFKDEYGVYKEIPLPESRSFGTDSDCFVRRVRRIATTSHPLDLDTFVQAFHGQKLLNYQKAAENLKRYNFIREKGDLKFFLKFETYNLTLKPEAKPRGINPRSFEFIVDYGRHIKAIEKKIYNCLEDIFGYDVIFKGKNQKQRGNLLEEYWGQFVDPVAIAADASAFEASVSVDALEFCHKIYNLFIRNSQSFKSMQLMQLVNKGKAYADDGKMEFCVNGKRASGDPDTALGNCLISAYMMFGFFLELGITKHRGCIDGDDVVFIVERCDVEKIISSGKAYYLRHGFRMVFESPVDELEQISFCQSSPIWMPDGYLMVRNPKNATSKDAISRKDLSQKVNFERWISSVGMCGLSCTGGVPVLQEYYQQYIRNANGAKMFDKEILLDDYKSYKTQGMKSIYQDVHPNTRLSFYIAFGVLPDEQVSIENYFAELILEHGQDEQLCMPTTFLPW